jgi:hypothetical protein
MKNRIALMVILVAACACLRADDIKSVYAKYFALLADPALSPPEKMEKVHKLLCALNKADSLSLVHELANDPKFAKKNSGEELWFSMGVFTSCYVRGPGKHESLMDTLGLLRDPTLPARWKRALLGNLQLDKHPDVLKPEFGPIVAFLLQWGEDKHNEDQLRVTCLWETKSILHMQRELIVRKAPQLKNAVERQDEAALDQVCRSEPGNLEAAGARKLVENIGKLRKAMRDASEEVKDVNGIQLKASMKLHADGLEPKQRN